jgi:hypothetical protein
MNDEEMTARHPDTSIEELTKLADNKDWYIRHWVSRHPNVPIKILIKLSNDVDVGVRYWVALHLNATADILIKLVNDENSGVSYAATHNHNCPPAVHLWLKQGGFAGMTLAEFLVATRQETP